MRGRSDSLVIIEALADSLMAEYGRRRIGGPPGHWGSYAGVHDPGLSAAFDVEVAALLHNAPWLKQAVRSACRLDADGNPHPDGREHLVHRLAQDLHGEQRHVRLSLEALLGADGRRVVLDQSAGASSPSGKDHRAATPRTRSGHGKKAGVRRVFVPLVLLNGIVLAVLAAPALYWLLATPPVQDHPLRLALSAAVVWAFAFLPGWLFVRFLDRRAGALWDEYVIHLHRLGVDGPGNLPEPPRSSSFHGPWAQDGGVARVWMRNVYREKFDAYYGRSVSRFGTNLDRPVKSEALFPVFLCTGLLAIGWTAVLYEPPVSFPVNDRLPPGDALSFGFLGAYLYFLQTLLRRYFQTDLRAGAYVSGYIRIVSAIVVVTVLHAAIGAVTPAAAMVAVAFVVGWFPPVGLQWLLRVASRRLRGAVPSVEPAYPLNRLDGLNVWYEGRLLEEGVEDLENLMTANVVDVLLHTRVPVARLVDWIDQALLLIHLPAEPAALDQPGAFHRKRVKAVVAARDHPRHYLRECGIRSATALLRALHESRDQADRKRLMDLLEKRGLSSGALLSIRDVIAADRRLTVVFNWQAGGAGPPSELPLDAVVASTSPSTRQQIVTRPGRGVDPDHPIAPPDAGGRQGNGRTTDGGGTATLEV